MDDKLAADKLADLAERTARNRKRHYARQPKSMKDIVGQLLAKRGYGATKANEELRGAWQTAVGPAMAKLSQATAIKRGKLEVVVSNNLVMQELGFDRSRLLAAMRKAMQDESIEEIRFRVGKITG